MVVSFSNAACIIYDAESQAVVTRLDTSQDPVSGQVRNGLLIDGLPIFLLVFSYSVLRHPSPRRWAR
jgi:hypothetical protein